MLEAKTYLSVQSVKHALLNISGDITLPKRYNALTNATVLHRDKSSYADILNAWLKCQKNIDNEYVLGIVKACTYVLLSTSLRRIGAQEDHITHVNRLARDCWNSV